MASMEEHPVWKSLDILLDDHKGEDIALRFISDKELTPLEFLSACASQAQFLSSSKKRVELLKAVRIGIAKDRKRTFGFGESIFRDLLNVAPFEDEFAAELVDAFIDICRLLDQKAATQALLKCLYDPVLTRIRTSEVAQTLGKRIIDILENELEAFTVQQLLLYSDFREREELEEGDSDSEASLSDWQNTSDTTESSLADREFGCPAESSAATAWVLAPHFLDPPVLNSYGRFIWCARHVRFLLNLPSNTLAAQRGLELFASFGSVTFPKSRKGVEEDDMIGEAYDTIIAAFRYVTAVQSIAGRDAIAGFIESVEPFTVRWHLMSKLARDTSQPPTIRGFAVDLLKKETLKTDQSLVPSSALALKLLESDSVDDQIVLACFALLQMIGLRAKKGHARCLDTAKLHAQRIREVVWPIHRQAKESEEEISKDDKFSLKLPSPITTTASNDGHKKEPVSTTNDGKRAEAPEGYFTPQAEHGRARLIAGVAEPLLELYKQW